MKPSKRNTKNGIKPNDCNQCEHTSSSAYKMREHLKTHSGEKPNKCNQCDYASSRADHLRTHSKTHSGEKLNKCSQCDYTPSQMCSQSLALFTTFLLEL